jgi:predicted RNA-binding Zn-ribbon protein involved in translation (DUF1610 family)
MKKKPPTCTDCGQKLNTISYMMWGTKRFDSKTNSYTENESLGNTDMEFTCPNCSAKIDPEGVIF